MNRGGVGTRLLNLELQAVLNPTSETKIERFGWVFAPGDKIMQIENDYDKEVYNGDMGHVLGVSPDDGELTASFDGRPVVYAFGELDALVPAYAVTIHKSQGSEYPAALLKVRQHALEKTVCGRQITQALHVRGGGAMALTLTSPAFNRTAKFPRSIPARARVSLRRLRGRVSPTALRVSS